MKIVGYLVRWFRANSKCITGFNMFLQRLFNVGRQLASSNVLTTFQSKLCMFSPQHNSCSEWNITSFSRLFPLLHRSLNSTIEKLLWNRKQNRIPEASNNWWEHVQVGCRKRKWTGESAGGRKMLCRCTFMRKTIQSHRWRFACDRRILGAHHRRWNPTRKGNNSWTKPTIHKSLILLSFLITGAIGWKRQFHIDRQTVGACESCWHTSDHRGEDNRTHEDTLQKEATKEFHASQFPSVSANHASHQFNYVKRFNRCRFSRSKSAAIVNGM